MLRNRWVSSVCAAQKLGITELELSDLREFGLLKPGIHWKSSPYGQMKPWNPEALYNVKLCRKLINEEKPFNQSNISAA